MKKVKRVVLHGLMALSLTATSLFYPLWSLPGPAVTVQAAEQSESGESIQRIYGSDRYETAAKVAQAGWKDSSDYAVLSAGMDANLVDALAAAPLAKLKNAPILLTQGNVLNPHAEAELVRLGVKTVYITAGSKIITEKVYDRLTQLGIKAVSLGGNDRFETAINIAQEMGNYHQLFVATANSNADALSVAAIAAAKGIPILLSNPDKVPDQVMSYISSVKANISKTYVLGGTGVLSDNVKNALPNSVRIGGLNRYSTNIEVLKTFAADLNPKTVYLANGEDNHLVDALTGAPLAALTNAPVLLSGKSLDSASEEYAKLHLGSTILALGGENVVPQVVASKLSSVTVYAQDGASLGSNDPAKPATLNSRIKIAGDNISLSNSKVSYSVYVQGDHVSLDNLDISGTLFLDPGADGTAEINNVKADKIVVLSGAKESIHLNNTEAGTLVVSSSSEVRVESSGSTAIGNTVVTSYAILDASGGSLGQVEVVSVAGQAPVVTFRGTFDQPIVVSGAATIRADLGASIASLEIAPENKDQKVTLDGNFNNVVVNQAAQIELSPDTTVVTMVTNVSADLNVPAGARIETLDKKGNDVAVAGNGNVGNAAPAASAGGGGGGGGPSGGDASVAVTGISVNPATMTLTAGGATGAITATITPANASNQNITWTSSDTEVATVDNTGVVTPVAAGTAIITATSAADDSIKASATVTVVDPAEGLIVTSHAFEDGDPIPARFSKYWDNESIPLQWNPIDGATNYALLMYDDIAYETPEGETEVFSFIHWAVTGITDLEDILSGATQYTNSFGEKGYGGPMPPAEDEPHTYKIAVYALDDSIELEDDDFWGIEKSDFENSLQGKIITTGVLTGTFGIAPITAEWRATGNIDFRAGDDIAGLFKEYELVVGEGENEEVISLANTNVKRVYFFSTEVPTSASTTLWFPMDLGFEIDAVEFIVTTHDHKAYRAELEMEDNETVSLLFKAPASAEAVFSLVDEFGPVYVIDFSTALVEHLIPLPSEESPETYAIELGFDTAGFSLSNVDRIVRVYTDGPVVEANLADEKSETNGQYVTIDWQPGFLTMYYIMKDGSIYKARLDITEPAVSNLIFNDEDDRFWTIEGTLNWNPPINTAHVDGYNIYLLDDNDFMVEHIATVNATTNSYPIEALQLPEEASKIGVFCYKGEYEYYPIAELDLKNIDDGSATSGPIITSVTDSDSNPGLDGSDFTVSWTPSTWHFQTVEYEIFILPSSVKSLSWEEIRDEEYSPITIVGPEITTWTGTASIQADSAGNPFSPQEYNVWVIEHSQGWFWFSNPDGFTPGSDPAV